VEGGQQYNFKWALGELESCYDTQKFDVRGMSISDDIFMISWAYDGMKECYDFGIENRDSTMADNTANPDEYQSNEMIYFYYAFDFCIREFSVSNTVLVPVSEWLDTIFGFVEFWEETEYTLWRTDIAYIDKCHIIATQAVMSNIDIGYTD
jgi:hypothetical protein